jgi:hypothetical protein
MRFSFDSVPHLLFLKIFKERGKMQKRICCLKTVGLILLTVFLSSCGLKYNIQEPSLSGINYGKTTISPTKLAIVDKRSGENKKFVLGKIGPGGELRDIANMFVTDQDN